MRLIAGTIGLWLLILAAFAQTAPRVIAGAFGLCLLASAAFAQQPPPLPTDMDLCRQQLTAAHDAADTRERKAFLALAEQHAAAEARQATLIEWLKVAQAGAKP